MVSITYQEIDQWLQEDVPYFDLTSHILGIQSQPGSIDYFTREPAVVSGTEEVLMIFERLGIKAQTSIPSGTTVNAGTIIVSGTGSADRLHKAWKVGQNILDHCCAIATRTRRMVDTVRQHNPDISVLTTRKGFPGTKKLAIKSILAGGAIPHRLGISETILIFRQHMEFIGGMEGLLTQIPAIKPTCIEKKLIVETSSYQEARLLCRAGVDGIQFDKLGPDELRESAQRLKSEFPHVVLLAAGGVNESNIAQYAQTGVDGIVTTSLYDVNPVDIGVNMKMV